MCLVIFLFRSVDQVVLASPFLASKQKINMQNEALVSISAKAGAGSCTLGRTFMDGRGHVKERKLVIFKFYFSPKLLII